MAKIYENIAATLDRADEISIELLKEYDRCLGAKEVSARAKQLTHDVCAQLRSALDRIARRYWEKYVAPNMSKEERDKATVYFPVAESERGMYSTLGRWRWTKDDHLAVGSFLIAKQPFSSENNKWLSIVNDLAVQGKHIDLLPQKKTEERRIVVQNQQGAGVSWNPAGVRFGAGVRVVGAPIDPATQRIVPTQGVTERVENWVSFEIEGYRVNAAAFTKDACREVRCIVQEMTDRFGLD